MNANGFLPKPIRWIFMIALILAQPFGPVSAAAINARAVQSASPTTPVTFVNYAPMIARNYVASAPPGQELANAFAGQYSGQTVTILGPFSDATSINRFNAALNSFRQRTGINIQYEGVADLKATLDARLKTGNQPDIAIFPQPGLLATYARAGHIIDMGPIISPYWLSRNYNQSWLDMATMPGLSGPIVTGVWYRINVKSLVWYPKNKFDQAGYSVPQTWDQLLALTSQIANAGSTPWCIGIESGAATGWPMTDWIEDAMLRTTSLENYDKWVKGQLKFDSPEVRNAIGKVTNIWFNDSYVYGGRASIATTSFGSAADPMFDNPPKCWLHRQASFIVPFFPSGKVYGQDYDFFYLPPIDAQYGKPWEAGGDIHAAMRDRPEVRALMQYFSTGDSIKGWLQLGGAISPHKDADLIWYTNPVDHKIAQLLQSATSMRYDGSDLMPGAVGAGSFWTQMTDYVIGTVDLNTALQAIDASWP
jgi:alpha-glucoside transport system substrate-binding protein